MKQDKKGFTLIELLAVIVILAIIALIAVPIVMNIISKANKSAFKDSAYGIIKAGELYYADKLLEVNGMENDAAFEFPNNIGDLQIKGSLPSSGGMIVTKEGKVAIAISNGKYCIKKGYNDNDVTIYENIENCQLPKEQLENLNPNINATDECIKYNDLCPKGTLVNVKVNASENYDFYVIKDTGTELTLIMNKNLGSKVAWINQANYTAAGGINYGSYGNTEKGPLTALKTLEERTVSWSNIPTNTYTLTDDGGGNKYQPITRSNERARMLTYTEANALGCTASSNSCPNYLYTNTSSSNTEISPYGYWLSTANSSAISYGWSIIYDGRPGHGDVGSVSYCGVRPVISVSKSL